MTRPPLARQTVFMLLGASVLLSPGCDTSTSALDAGSEPSCLQDLEPTCEPLYLPTTFDNVFERTLVPGCTLGSTSCHGPEGAKGGLSFDEADPDAAWAALLSPSETEPRVVAGEPACSPLVHHIVSDDSAFQMPPGTGLSGPESCAVIQWIRDGALR